jgi:protoheme IX farnesyltransferase
MTRLARYAWFVLLFNVGVILVGAWVRATGSGAGCGRHWPSCQGEVIPKLEGATAVEFTHRAVSGVALGLVAVLVIWVYRSVPRGGQARVGATVAAVSILGEALIGAAIVLAEWVADDASAARAVAVPLHLVNTLLLLAALALTAFWLSGGRRLDWSGDPALRRWVIVGGVALVVLAATGAVTALADTLFPKGAATSREESFLTGLRVIHPLLAGFAASVGWLVWRRGEPRDPLVAVALPTLVGAMLVSGVLNVTLGVPVWMQLLHLLLADGLWVVYVLASASAMQVRPAEAQVAA